MEAKALEAIENAIFAIKHLQLKACEFTRGALQGSLGDKQKPGRAAFRQARRALLAYVRPTAITVAHVRPVSRENGAQTGRRIARAKQ